MIRSEATTQTTAVISQYERIIEIMTGLQQPSRKTRKETTGWNGGMKTRDRCLFYLVNCPLACQ